MMILLSTSCMAQGSFLSLRCSRCQSTGSLMPAKTPDAASLSSMRPRSAAPSSSVPDGRPSAGPIPRLRNRSIRYLSLKSSGTERVMVRMASALLWSKVSKCGSVFAGAVGVPFSSCRRSVRVCPDIS
jgi:hypothetical protein